MKKIALFSNDAGASEILLELILANLDKFKFTIYTLTDSPCHLLTIKKDLQKLICFIEPSRNDIFSKLINFAPDIVIYGTGWQNHLEYFFLEYAKKKNILSIAFLDHYTNYKERFQDKYPSFVATHDKYSENLAKELNLPNVVAIKNYSLISMQKETILEKKKDILLFLSEPTSKVAKKSFDNANYWGFDEIDVFKNISTCKEKLGCKKLIIRLHPSDKKNTYEKLEENIEFSNSSLLEDINKAKIIIGIDTIALQTAYLLGKKVISYIPSNKRDFSLPLPKNNKTKDLANFNIKNIEINKEPIDDFGIDFALFIKKELG